MENKRRFWINFPLIIIFTLLLPLAASAFQFGDYEWGKSIEEIRAVARAKKKSLKPSDNPALLIYSEESFGKPCEVSLIFTPGSRILYAIKVIWQESSVGPKVKKSLIEKHGEALQEEKNTDKYLWIDSVSGDLIALDYSAAQTELIYSVGEK